MKKAELQEASRIADYCSELQCNWLVYESQALFPDDAAALIGLGVVEHEMTCRTGKLVYTIRTPYGAKVADVIAARRIADSWPEEHQRLLAHAEMESTEVTRALAVTPLFDQRRSKDTVRVRRTPMGTVVFAWLCKSKRLLFPDGVPDAPVY